MKFTKMQGCGNDYIYVNCFTETVADPSAAAIRLSDRHFGVGGDGLVLICPSNVADFAWRCTMPTVRVRKCAAMPSAVWANTSTTAV